MSTQFDYDLFVIGAGSGGVRASRIAAGLGGKVAVAEDRYLGGTCVNVGCVPKKLFVYASEYHSAIDDAKGFGVAAKDVDFDWPTLRDNKNQEISRLNGIYGNLLKNTGVTLYNGRARLTGPNTVDVNGQSISAKTILIATGGWPYVPNIPGKELAITSNEVFYLEQFPKSALVVGGGYIAVEFAGIFAGLGCETELVYRGQQFLRGFDQDVRDFVADEVAKNGVTLSFNSNISALEKQGYKIKAVFEDGSERVVDTVLYATGRVAHTQDLGLETVNVALNDNGSIKVNNNFQTSEPSVYALGDVIGRVQLTPVALAEGMALAHHLFADKAINLDYQLIPTAVFCQPNIGTVGLSEEQARAAGHDVAIFRSDFKAMRHTMSGRNERTLMKLIVDKESDKVLGVHMVGPDAGEIIQGLAVALKAGATKAVFDATIGIHPTAAEEFVTMRQAVS